MEECIVVMLEAWGVGTGVTCLNSVHETFHEIDLLGKDTNIQIICLFFFPNKPKNVSTI